MIDELVYEDIDSGGAPLKPKDRPKWTKPKGDVQIAILAAVGRTYYDNRSEQSAVNDIARKCLSLKKVESPYPLEWVQTCCQWAIDKRKKRQWVKLQGLLTLITDPDRKVRWLDENRSKYEPEESWDDYANRDLA